MENWKGVLKEGQLIALDYTGAIREPSGHRPFPYDIPNRSFTGIGSKRPYLNLYSSWRSVAAHPWIWGQETFMDELAYAAGVDPV